MSLQVSHRLNFAYLLLSFSFADIVVLVSIVILIGLFSMQHYGTDKVGWLFAPIVLIWFLFIGATGIYNIFKHDTSVLKAFSPTYIYLYFKRRGRDGWISLGGILLSITGHLYLYISKRFILKPSLNVSSRTFQARRHYTQTLLISRY